MNYEVFWTEESEKTFNKNIEYLSESWDRTPPLTTFWIG